MCSRQQLQVINLALQRHQLSSLVVTHPLQVLSLGSALPHTNNTSASFASPTIDL